MKTSNCILFALLTLIMSLFISHASAQSRQPFGASLGIASDGSQYVKCSNFTSRRLSLSITYRKTYADGTRRLVPTTAILEPGEKNKEVDKCAIPFPKEKIDEIKITESKFMTQ